MNGLQVRRTIEILAAILQKMTMSCIRLCDIGGARGCPYEAIRVTTDIKHHYLQLMAMEGVDLKALVNAFQLVFPTDQVSLQRPEQIIREVSNDEEEPLAPLLSSNTNQILPLPPPAVLRSTNTNVNANNIYFQDPSSLPVKRSREPFLPFSPPISEDMRTNPGFPQADDRLSHAVQMVEEHDEGNYEEMEYDDLRRQYGSTDYDEEEENREGPAGEITRQSTSFHFQQGYYDDRATYPVSAWNK